jgi:hypothetical protein
MNSSEHEVLAADINAQRILLSDGFSVTREFLDEIKRQIECRLPELKRGRRYTAKQLAGNEFWNLLTPGEKPLTGRCIAYLVTRGLLLLAFVPGKHEYPKLYCLI